MASHNTPCVTDLHRIFLLFFDRSVLFVGHAPHLKVACDAVLSDVVRVLGISLRVCMSVNMSSKPYTIQYTP